MNARMPSWGSCVWGFRVPHRCPLSQPVADFPAVRHARYMLHRFLLFLFLFSLFFFFRHNGPACYTGLLLRKIQTPTAGVIFSAYLQALFEISYYSLFESLRASLRCACGNCDRGRYRRRPNVQNLSTLTSLHHLQPLLPLGFIPRQPNT